MKLLLIEDNPIWQTKLEMILVELNYCEIDLCENIEGAEKYLSHTIPDLIIADIVLGDELIFDLFKNDTHKHIPCLFVTSHEETELYQLSKEIPDSFFLIKPFHKLTVLSAIDKVLQHHKKLIPLNQFGVEVKGPYGEKIFLKPEQVVYSKSELNYCLIKTPKNQFLLKASLIHLKEKLGPDIIQIHKTYMVNKNYIKNIFLQKMKIETECGTLPIGRLFKAQIINFMKEKVVL
jgi:DNA-binding LytR/AlgR family response regulator